MIEKIEVSGSNYKVGDALQKYTEKHIGKLSRFLPKGSSSYCIFSRLL